MATEFHPTRFDRLPPVVLNIIIINVIIFIAQFCLQKYNVDVYGLGALHHWQSPYFKVWQPLTSMFMHGSLQHIFFNMFGVYMFGGILENLWGSKRFLNYYLICGLGAGLCHILVQHFTGSPENIAYGSSVGASGALFGLLFAFGYLFPNSLIYVYLAIPIKAKWFVLFYGLYELYAGFANAATDNVAHFAHLGGLVFGFIIIQYWNRTNRKDFF